MKQKTGSKLLGVLLTLAMVVGLTLGMSLTAYAAEESESFSTNQELSTYTGEHFTITCTDVGDGDGFYISTSKSATISARNGEIITKVEFTEGCYVIDRLRSATGTVTYNGDVATVSGVNATSLTVDASDALQIKAVKVYYTIAPAHSHNFTYSASGDTITATCSATGCSLPPSSEGAGDHVAKFTIAKPLHETYGDGKDENATITTVPDPIDGVTIPSPVYKKGDETLSGAPAGAGTYTASITLGEGDAAKTASVGYTIAKATTTIEKIPAIADITYGQTLANSALTGGVASQPGSFAWKDPTATPAVSDSQKTEYEVIFTPADGNYATAVCKVKLTVNKADSAVAKAPEAKALAYNGQAQELVNAGSTNDGEIYYELGADATNAPSGMGGDASVPTGTEAGTYYVWYKVVGDDNHLDSKPACVSVSIAKGDASKAKVTLSQTSYTYDGKAKTPAVKSVVLDGKALKAGTDYTVSYANNVKVGIATVTVTGKGGYAGSAKATFTIKAAPTPTPTPTPTPSGKTIDMHRLYNPNTGEHFYTASTEERDTLTPLGWRYEGLGWVAPASSKSPVYRLYNPNSGDHHYTLSAEERDALTPLGWRYEGIGWYSDDAKGTPLYRQFNPNEVIGTHNYTFSRSENDYLASIGWHAEGIGWYGVKSSATPADAKALSAQGGGSLAAAHL